MKIGATNLAFHIGENNLHASEKVHFAANGKVGIGTASPETVLDVRVPGASSGDVDSNGLITIGNAAEGYYGMIGFGKEGGATMKIGATNLAFHIGENNLHASEKMIITSGGTVRIGPPLAGNVAKPATVLSLATPGTSSGDVNGVGVLTIGNANEGYYGMIGFNNAPGASSMKIGATNLAFHIGATSLGAPEKVRFTNEGKVSIGTAPLTGDMWYSPRLSVAQYGSGGIGTTGTIQVGYGQGFFEIGIHGGSGPETGYVGLTSRAAGKGISFGVTSTATEWHAMKLDPGGHLNVAGNLNYGGSINGRRLFEELDEHDAAINDLRRRRRLEENASEKVANFETVISKMAKRIEVLEAALEKFTK